ncbi:hypothetical protein G9C85_16800 [Halorubellus sp. JP-L1]|uniref:hypothetical protein n=1 Tax=Halorubellus sp. JP-L1 TaxID=2715753 RepID=UPI0014077AD1|nr:hypothetical protein [Halorubellus sp. JP-L1]NHN43278.1 hypothetical protein [Halorubellus sp. JP-L1]
MVDASTDDRADATASEPTDYEARAFALRDRAVQARDAFDPPTGSLDRDRAVEFARDGVGEAAATYIDARTEDSWVYFEPEAFDALETGLNAYLELFAACYGVDCNPDVTVRTAAETLLDTHDAVDTAAVLTGVDEVRD